MLLTFMPGILMAQELTITGKVTDNTGETLPGVYVVVKGTNAGTVTNGEGAYSISVSNTDAILVFSYLGYITQEFQVGTQKVLNVALETDIRQLEEVVVIGYGTVKKEDATGSVAVIGSDDFNKGAISSPQDLLVGKTAGVTITSINGAPGSGSTIRIRGGSSLSASNNPLIVVDGVPLDDEGPSGMSNGLSTINPNDIESITVLKDASATAIYGSRASNGVMIITTKRGAQKFQVSYSGNVSLYTIAKTLDVLNGDEFRDLVRSRYAAGSAPDTLLGTANTDWQNEIYKTALGQDHNLSISGTVKKINMPYRVSLGYTNQDGILKTSNFERTTASIAITPVLLDDHLTIDINVKGMYNQNQFASQPAIGAAVRFDPTQPVYDPTSPSGYFNWTENGKPRKIALGNPVARINLTKDLSTVKRSIGNLKADYKLHFLPELKATVNLGYDYSWTDGTVDVPASASWEYDDAVGGGVNKDYEQEKRSQLVDLYLTYNKDISSISSNIEIMGGYSWSHFWRDTYTFETNIYTSDANRRVRQDNSDPTEYYIVSFFGRLNYSLMDKYLVTVNLRNDGTSRFAENNRWGLFPSVALAWKIKSESFLASVNAINELKLRLGYGVTGQQNLGLGDYPYLARYTRTTVDNTALYQIGSAFLATLRPEGYDLNLKWEETTTMNAGLDFGFLNNRIYGSLDVYKRITKDLLNKIPVPAGSNLTNELLTNVGDLENKGVEFSINTGIISRPDLKWEVGYNIGYNENKITKLTKTDDPNYIGVFVGDISGGVGNKIQVHSVNYAANSYFVYQQVYDNNDKPIEGLYVDRNEDGVVNEDDKFRYKQPAADILMGISSKLNYKNWDFSFAGRVSLGNYVYNNVYSNNGTYLDVYNSGLNYLSNVLTSASDADFNNAQYFSDYYVENASFFRMDNMSLGYRFNNLMKNKINVHIGAVVQNAFVITKYEGLDPEVDGGIDNNFYPRARTFMLGINVDF
jgi:iron complex outermembrane receptor protein